MKYFLLCSIPFLFFLSPGKIDCDKLPNGKYLVHFTQGAYKDYRINIHDSTFVQYSNSHDSVYGKINWIDKCIFSMKFSTKNDMDSVVGPLKLMHASWGSPCIELKDIKKGTIEFRTTYSANLHITVNEGYFLKMPE
jgi:hypothetical protein